VNLLLFRLDECDRPLPHADPRAVHLRQVLHRDVGGEFDAGLINGPRGRGRIEAVRDDGLHLAFRWEHTAPAADAVTLLLGLPRPQTARDILRDATTLGVAALHFVATEKSDPGYAQSSLWHDGEWERHLHAGAAQAFSTLVPAVSAGRTLAEILAGLPGGESRLALDNYEATAALASAPLAAGQPLVLALGPERGWGPRDRAALRTAGFRLVHLGSRVLRLETAVTAALVLAKAARGTL
jgi:16S rRNA (uracil1498-N3)-methyltransferase